MKRNLLISRLENEVELLSRHLEILNAIKANEPIGITRLAQILDRPHHKVRYSLRVLEQEGLIEPSPDGAVTTKKVAYFNARLMDSIAPMIKMLKDIQKEL